MAKQVLLPLAGAALFIVIVGLLTQGKLSFKPLSSTPQDKPKISLAGTKINVEIADSAEERAKGLSGRDSLGKNEGMLFVFESKNVTPSFWMKDMKFPLDIIWINDGKIAKIDKNVPVKPEDKLYKPSAPIDYVLEVSAGFSDENKLKVGDLVKGDPIQN